MVTYEISADELLRCERSLMAVALHLRPCVVCGGAFGMSFDPHGIITRCARCEAEAPGDCDYGPYLASTLAKAYLDRVAEALIPGRFWR